MEHSVPVYLLVIPFVSTLDKMSAEAAYEHTKTFRWIVLLIFCLRLKFTWLVTTSLVLFFHCLDLHVDSDKVFPSVGKLQHNFLIKSLCPVGTGIRWLLPFHKADFVGLIIIVFMAIKPAFRVWNPDVSDDCAKNRQITLFMFTEEQLLA